MTTALDSSCCEFFEFWIWTNHNSLLSIATNQFASFFIDIRSPLCYIRVCQSGEIWNKRAFFPCILMTSKCGKNISDTLGCASCATFLFLPHFDVICDLLLNRRTATWNLFVKYIYINYGTPFFKLGELYIFRITINYCIHNCIKINNFHGFWKTWLLVLK